MVRRDWIKPLVFTIGQLESMLDNAKETTGRQVVYASSPDETHPELQHHLIGNDPTPAAEGDGVWVDPEGHEHHGPHSHG